MRQKLGCLAQKTCPLYTFSFLMYVQSFLPKDNLFKNIFDFTTADDWDCVAAVARIHALHSSVDFIILSFGIMNSIVGL